VIRVNVRQTAGKATAINAVTTATKTADELPRLGPGRWRDGVVLFFLSLENTSDPSSDFDGFQMKGRGRYFEFGAVIMVVFESLLATTR
jgi:hypothetical protein